ncbi:MAG TPA: hypothetical protein VGX03_20345 [Candidatus Binatia bacterium]|jgi:hypothetical protein|nr:hypothetical protein [Candidatus Binatia bacterium]
MDSAFWYRAQTLPGSTTYAGWTTLYGCLISTPVAAVTAQGGLEVFGQGCDAKLWRNTLGAWNQIDTSGAPAWLSYEEPDVARDVKGDFHVFMRASTGILWRGDQQTNGTYTWASLGGPAMAGPAEVIRNTDTSASLQLFAPSASGDIWTAFQSAGQWQPLSSLGHPLVGTTHWLVYGGVFPIVNKLGRWEMFSTPCSQNQAEGCSLWTRRRTVAGAGTGSLTAWTRIGGNLASDPDGALNAASGLHIVAVGSDLQMYCWYQTAPESSWTLRVLPAPAEITWASAPNVLRNTDGRLEVFAKGSDGGLWHNWETAPMGAWAGWSAFGGGVMGF